MKQTMLLMENTRARKKPPVVPPEKGQIHRYLLFYFHENIYIFLLTYFVRKII